MRFTASSTAKVPVTPEQWALYGKVLAGARQRGIRFALGGGFAVSAYTGQWRFSKDLDVYILPQDRDAMVEVTAAAGLQDYFDKVPYDRTWIYRSFSGDVIVDAMWSMANHRAPVDICWLERGAMVTVEGELLRVLPPEELMWDKLYVLQHDRCDWPDALNLIYCVGRHLDWERVLERVGPDLPLLAGALAVFQWMCPGCLEAVPAWVWGRVGVDVPPTGPEADRARVDLLDRRAWFPVPGGAL